MEVLLAFCRMNQTFGLACKNTSSLRLWEQTFEYPADGGALGSEHPKLVKTLPRFFNFYPWCLQYRELSGGMSFFSNTRQNVKFICYENNPTNLFFSPSKSGVDSQGCAQLVIGQASESPPNQCQTTVLSYECLRKSYWNTWQLGRYDGSRRAYITRQSKLAHQRHLVHSLMISLVASCYMCLTLSCSVASSIEVLVCLEGTG